MIQILIYKNVVDPNLKVSFNSEKKNISISTKSNWWYNLIATTKLHEVYEKRVSQMWNFLLVLRREISIDRKSSFHKHKPERWQLNKLWTATRKYKYTSNTYILCQSLVIIYWKAYTHVYLASYNMVIIVHTTHWPLGLMKP